LIPRQNYVEECSCFSWKSTFARRCVDRVRVDAKDKYTRSNRDIGICFTAYVCSHQYSFKLCSCVLFKYMFQHFHLELIPRASVNGYRGMYIVIFKRECVIILCNAHAVVTSNKQSVLSSALSLYYLCCTGDDRRAIEAAIAYLFYFS
jgi:hypothetical protein